MVKSIKFLGLVMFLNFFLASSSFAKIGNEPLIKINNRTITVDEFKRMSQISSFQAQMSNKDIKKTIDNVIFFVRGVQEGRKRGYVKLTSIKDTIDMALFGAYFNKDIRPKIAKLKIPQAQVEAEYKKMPVINAFHILIPSNPDDSAQDKTRAKQRATSIYKQLVKTPLRQRETVFSRLAKRFSADPSRGNGGRLGYIGADQALPHFYLVVKDLKAGEVSKPFASVYGWHVAYVANVLAAREMGPQYYAFLQSKIRTQKGIKIMEAEASKLRQNAKISVNNKLLKNIRY